MKTLHFITVAIILTLYFWTEQLLQPLQKTDRDTLRSAVW